MRQSTYSIPDPDDLHHRYYGDTHGTYCPNTNTSAGSVVTSSTDSDTTCNSSGSSGVIHYIFVGSNQSEDEPVWVDAPWWLPRNTPPKRLVLKTKAQSPHVGFRRRFDWRAAPRWRRGVWKAKS